MAKNEEGYIVRSFIASFKRNWKKSTAVWLMTIGIGCLLLSDFYVYAHMERRIGVLLLTSTALLTAVYLMMLIYAFPLMVRWDKDLKTILAAAFVLALKNPRWTIFMLVAAAGIVAVGVFVMAPFLIISAGLIAYLHGKILYMLLREKKILAL